MSGPPSVIQIDRLELSFAPQSWTYAVEKRGAIDEFFAALQRKFPAVWNGRVLVLHSQSLADGVFRGAYLETDYASFAAWRAWGRPPAGVHDCFGAAAIVAADGAVLLGVMGEHTVQAGRVYFPCGTPDRNDIVDGRVDLDLSAQRELREETGLDVAEFTAEPGWTAVFDGSLIMQVKVLRSGEGAKVLRARILAFLARQKQPELADIRIVRGASDFTDAMPRFVTAFLAQRFAVR
jgi:8-oxo-dGTP pyrophosphatase MutT (NUDIX family)